MNEFESDITVEDIEDTDGVVHKPPMFESDHEEAQCLKLVFFDATPAELLSDDFLKKSLTITFAAKYSLTVSKCDINGNEVFLSFNEKKGINYFIIMLWKTIISSMIKIMKVYSDLFNKYCY